MAGSTTLAFLSPLQRSGMARETKLARPRRMIAESERQSVFKVDIPVRCGNDSYYGCRVDRDPRGVAAHQAPSVPDCQCEGRDDDPGGDPRHPRADGLLVIALEFTRWELLPYKEGGVPLTVL
ncbi:hypothetical protein B0H14DRAFT_2581966 [Mycena olivaceomarginata]|nr:hypothetical protein B0H14DRAFT_2581966 [Mycena olivaceomarginata]